MIADTEDQTAFGLDERKIFDDEVSWYLASELREK